MLRIGNKIVEFFKKYQDHILVSLFFGLVIGIAIKGGAFLVSTLTWTAISFTVGGLFLGLGNEMFHSIRRTLTGKVWPYLRDRVWPRIKGLFTSLLG